MLTKQQLAKILSEKAAKGTLNSSVPSLKRPGMAQPMSPMGNNAMNAPQASTDPLLNLQNNLGSPPQINLAPKKGLKQPKFPNLMKSFKPSQNI